MPNRGVVKSEMSWFGNVLGCAGDVGDLARRRPVKLQSLRPYGSGAAGALESVLNLRDWTSFSDGEAMSAVLALAYCVVPCLAYSVEAAGAGAITSRISSVRSASGDAPADDEPTVLLPLLAGPAAGCGHVIIGAGGSRQVQPNRNR